MTPHRPTPRQEQVAALLCDGLPDKEIAALLGIRPATVTSHVHGLRVRLGADSRVQAVVLWDRGRRG